MEAKHLLALMLILAAGGAGGTVMLFSRQARSLAFFLLVAAAPITDRLDVHFFSREWYRGTTRGFEVSLLDVAAFCLLATAWLAPGGGRPRSYWPAGLGLMALNFLYAGASVLMYEPKLYGAFELSKMLRGIVVFLAAALFVRSRREAAILVFALACAACFEGGLALRERFLEGLYRVAGSLGHPNSLSMYLCTVGPVLVAGAAADFPRWLRRSCGAGIAAASVAALFTLSRAGVPIFAFVMLGAAARCFAWSITPRTVAAALAVALGAGVLAYSSWDYLASRYRESSLTEEYMEQSGTAEGRGVYLRWARAIVRDHFFGVGLNNWSYWVSKDYGPRVGFPYTDYDSLGSSVLSKETMANAYLAAPAHNLAALTAGELGLPGLLLFGLLWLRWFGVGAGFLRRRSGDPMRVLGTGIFFGMCGIFLQSMTEWTYRQTSIYFTFLVLAGALAGLHEAGKRPDGVPDDRAGALDEAQADKAKPSREEQAFAAGRH